MTGRATDVDEALVRICDLAGRPRGTGFLADGAGTLLTSHEAVDGLPRLVLHAHGDRTILVDAASAVTPLPELGLALVATDGLAVPPLPVAGSGPAHAQGRVRLRGRTWMDAAIVGSTPVTYTATDRFHLLDEAYELVVEPLHPQASGTPVLDAETGAVLGVVATALQAGHRASGFALPLRGAALAELLARNAATVPAYGRHLNLAGALQLTATSVGSAGMPREWREPVARPGTAEELSAFLTGAGPLVLGLVGDPGSGRTTELTALAARRTVGAQPEPTVWLRGAELRPGDGGVKDAVERSLRTAARIVHAAAGGTGEPPAASPDAVAGLARTCGRPLLVLLDGPEEMPPPLAHALPDWTAGTASWLRAGGVRLVVACRPEYWEQAGALFPRGMLYAAGTGGTAGTAGTAGAGRQAAGSRALPDCVRLGDLLPAEAERARARYGIPAGALAEEDAAHPLALRLLSEVRAALPDASGMGTRPLPSAVGALPLASPGVPTAKPGGGPLDRDGIFSAYLDLVCLRIAVRLAAGGQVRSTAVRRLAARVAGQVHEAARRCLGPGQGELDRESFEELFPWREGWASAVFTEGLVVPAGAGYRFAHEEFADWLQGRHLDLDAALHALVHRWFAAPSNDADAGEAPVRLPSRLPSRRASPARHAPGPPVPPAPPLAPPAGPRALPVPRHRIGPVVQSLLLTARESGSMELARRLAELVRVLDLAREPGPAEPRQSDALWWAAHLLGEVLLRVPDAMPYWGVLRLLAQRVTARAIERGGFEAGCAPAGLGRFGPWFWLRLAIPLPDRLDLLRLLLPADPPPQAGPAVVGEERFLTAVAELLGDRPRAAMPVVCGWFDDERLLQASATVAGAAQALLHTHRRRAVDDLTEALVAAAHPRADELLAALAEDEPSAVCRAVDRWAHDKRPERHVAAISYGLRAAPHVTSDADRELLRYAALAVLARPADCTLHGGALALLVRDPATRSRHLPDALRYFAAGDPHLPVSALATALSTHPEAVLAAVQARLREPGEGAREVLLELAEVTDPALARRVAGLVREHLEHRPEGAVHVAAYLDRRLEHGPGARSVLLPLAIGLLRDHPPEVRRALAPVLAAPGTHTSRPLRQELLDDLLDHERDPGVLEALLSAAADGCARRPAPMTRDLVHRIGLLLGRTAEGAAHFDRRLVQLAEGSPGFARQVRGWLAAPGGGWDAVLGPGARRMFEQLNPDPGTSPPAALAR